tara:strand:+ start:528 stop:2006 length:1479 start_codon:yes stop_codon:yes gene_type:complete
MKQSPLKARGSWGWLAGILALTCSLLPASGPTTRQPPNIIFILADDLGWAELGCYGNSFNETPNLDRMARQGVRFTEAYAAAPVCSPYRASFLTGQYPARHGILDYLRPNTASPLSIDHVTLAEMLSKNGYATCMIGKWHLSGYRYHGAARELRATDHGFDEELASEVKGVGNGANFWPYVFRTQPIRWLNIRENRLGKEEYLVDRMNHEAVQFIERNRKRPFFLYLSHYATHSILNGKPAIVEKYRRKHPPGKSTRKRCYLCQDAGQQGDPGNHWAPDHNPHLAAMLESIDDGVGMILEKLKELKLDHNTLVVFSSDNGGESQVTSNAPLRGGKSSLYEGGIRVPLVVQWPAVVPAGKTCSTPTSNIDFYPTFLDTAGITPSAKQKLDGRSILAHLKEPGDIPRTTPLFWHYPLARPHFLGGHSGGAIRKGPWKLIEWFDTKKVELFNLQDDPSEKNNLFAQQEQTAGRLLAELRAWRKELGAKTTVEKKN